MSGVWDGCGSGYAIKGIGDSMANSVYGVGMQLKLQAMFGGDSPISFGVM